MNNVTMMFLELEMAPCPFCGKQVSILKPGECARLHRPIKHGYGIVCWGCSMFWGYDPDYGGVYEEAERAVNDWNKRVEEKTDGI